MPPPPLRKPVPATGGAPTPSNGRTPPGDYVAELQRAVAEWQAYGQQQRDEAQRQRQRADAAEATLAREREASAALLLRFEVLRRQSGRDVPVEVVQDAANDVVASTLGEAYRAWCEQGGPLVSRGFMFQRTLAEALPRAEVGTGVLVADDRLASDDGFGRLSHQGEMWIVRATPEDVFALPVPLSNQHFGPSGRIVEVAPDAVPRSLAYVRPARLTAAADGFALARPGAVR